MNDTLNRQLTESAEAVDSALAQLADAMRQQSDAVQAAISAGLDPDEIADAAGLTTGQVWNAGRGVPISPPPLDSCSRVRS